MNLIKKEYVRILEWGFKLTYLLLGLVSFNAFLYDSPIQPLLVKICLVMGGLTLLGRLFFFKDYMKTPYWWLLVLFCISFFVSMALNRQYGAFMSDFKWLIWTVMLFFLLYLCDGKRDTKEYKREFTVFSHVIIIYSFFASAAGLYLLLRMYQAEWYTASGELMLAGFHWGRLWGVYTDPNYGGVFSVISILLCVYYIRMRKSWKKIPYAAAVLPNFLYIIFSDSRTAVVAMAVSAAFWIAFAAGTKYKKKRIVSLLAAAIFAIVFAAVFTGGNSFIKTQYAKIAGAELGREEDLQNNVTNGRLELWKSGMEVWRTKPMFGTGYNSFVPYAEENCPQTYAVNNPQKVSYVSLHNEIVNILVYHGVVGLGIILLFAGLVFIYWVNSVKKLEDEDRDYMAVMASCILAVAVSMFFLLEGMHTNSPGAFVLWTFAGYIMHYCMKKRKAD